MSQIFSYTISDKKKSYSDYIKNKKENNIEGKIKVIEKEKQDPKSDTTKKKNMCNRKCNRVVECEEILK
jgi:hypothetical protein